MREARPTFARLQNAARMLPSKVNCPSEDNHEAHFAQHSWHFDIAHRRVTDGRYRCGHGDEGPTTHGGDRASCVYQPLVFSRYELPVELVRGYDLRHRRRGRDLAESRHTLQWVITRRSGISHREGQQSGAMESGEQRGEPVKHWD